jgi:hypothetical protein
MFGVTILAGVGSERQWRRKSSRLSTEGSGSEEGTSGPLRSYDSRGGCRHVNLTNGQLPP